MMNRSYGIFILIILLFTGAGIYSTFAVSEPSSETFSIDAPAVAQKENRMQKDIRLPKASVIEITIESRTWNYLKKIPALSAGKAFLYSQIPIPALDYPSAAGLPGPVYLIFLNLRI